MDDAFYACTRVCTRHIDTHNSSGKAEIPVQSGCKRHGMLTSSTPSALHKVRTVPHWILGLLYIPKSKYPDVTSLSFFVDFRFIKPWSHDKQWRREKDEYMA